MTKSPSKLQICLVASAGGHLTQLLRLLQAWQPYHVFYVSTLDMAAVKLQQYGKTYIIGECNREHPLKVLIVLMRCLKIILKERPNVVISTGAAPGFLFGIIGKLFGAKIIWIDSIANIKGLSLSGRLIRPFADLILSQWQEVADKYRNVVFAGAVI